MIIKEERGITMKTMEIKDVHLRVKNIEKSAKFYQDIMGLSLVSMDENEAILKIGTSSLYLKKGESVGSLTTGLYHFAVLLPSEEDLGRFLHHLSQMGFYEVGAGDHIYSQALYFEDLDGIGIEVYADRPRDQWVYEGDSLKAATLPVDVQRLLKIGVGSWHGMPKDSKIGHIHLQVRDLDNVRDVYVDGMGFEIKTAIPTALFISKDGYHHHIGANTWAGTDIVLREENMTGLDYFTLAVDDIDWYKEHLKGYKEIEDGLEVVDGNGIKFHLTSL